MGLGGQPLLNWVEQSSGHKEWFILDKKGRYKLRLMAETDDPNNTVYARVRGGARDASSFNFWGIALLVLAGIGFFGTSVIYKERTDAW